MTLNKIYIGGWFQRTTLHLTEIWNFLKFGSSDLGFEQKELDEAREKLQVAGLTRESGPLEYISVDTVAGVAYRIYEDGLIVLEKQAGELAKDFEEIKRYYDERLAKALSFIFSKGAPVPKELANIKTILPYIVTVTEGKKADIEAIYRDAGEEIYSSVKSSSTEVYRGPGIIVINNLKNDDLSREIIETQIFFREFKTQLLRYLAIHRSIWEKIRNIKERGQIKGVEIDRFRNELSVYQKTITLIGARIDQMPAYVRTRQKVTDINRFDDNLQPLFQLKFETLLDTHEYTKHLWGMTSSYLDSAVELFTELQTKSTKNSISSLQLITTIGVVAGLIGYLGKDVLPGFTAVGLFYLALLMILTLAINAAVSKLYKNRSYSISDKEIEKNL